MKQEKELEKLILSGRCCSESIVRYGLLLRNEENEQLADAAAALCNGLWSQWTCGVVTGGAILLSLFDKKKACAEMIPQLTEWFDDVYGREYGSVNCEDISEGNARYRMERCRVMIPAVVEKCEEILISYGYLEETT